MSSVNSTRESKFKLPVKKQLARQRLIVAADQLFSELGGYDGGYEATTIDLIVERAEVSRRSFFNYFTGKADVLLLDLKTSIQHHLEVFDLRRDETHPFISALLSAEDIYQQFIEDPVNRRRFERQFKYGMRPNQYSILGEWEEKLGVKIAKKLKGKNRRDRGNIMAGHALLIIRLANEKWYRSGLKNGNAAINSLKITKRLANDIVEELYPID